MIGGIDWVRAIKHAEIVAVENIRSDVQPKPEHAMWELMKEAVQVSSIAYSAPPRVGYPSKSSLPDTVDDVSDWQRMAAYLRGELSEMPTGHARPPQPSAEQITRAEAVLAIWHTHALSRKGAKSRIKKAVYMKASGVPDRKVRAVTGMTRQAIHSAKDEAMRDMLCAVRRFC